MNFPPNPPRDTGQAPPMALVPERFFLGACLALLAAAIVLARSNGDPALLLVIYRGSESESSKLWKSLSALGSLWSLVPLVALAAVLLYRRGRQEQALWLAAGFALTTALAETMKWLIARHRPPVPFLTAVRGASFPSGHAAESLFVFYYLWIVFQGSFFWRKRDPLSQIARELVSIVLAGLPALIGYSRVWLGVHWPSDVLAGWAIGFFVLEIVFLGTPIEEQNSRPGGAGQIASAGSSAAMNRPRDSSDYSLDDASRVSVRDSSDETAR
jgi:undecaprenyl-diphosphatase